MTTRYTGQLTTAEAAAEHEAEHAADHAAARLAASPHSRDCTLRGMWIEHRFMHPGWRIHGTAEGSSESVTIDSRHWTQAERDAFEHSPSVVAALESSSGPEEIPLKAVLRGSRVGGEFIAHYAYVITG